MSAPDPPVVGPVVVVPETNSRLDQLAAAYAVAKPAADAAKEHLDMIVNGIKAELHQAAPSADRVDLNAATLAAPLRLQSRTSWKLDTTKLKAEAPELYVRYARQSSYWELRAVASREAS